MSVSTLRRRLRLGLVASVALAVVGSRIGAQSTMPTARRASPLDYAAIGSVSEQARVRPNPLESDPDAVAAGQKLYTEHCAGCHGKGLEGSERAVSLQRDEVREAAPGAIFWILTNGVVRRGMPVWSKLPEIQRWQLVSFLKSSDRSAAPASSPSQP